VKTVNDVAIEIAGVGKLYRLWARQSDKVLDAFGLGWLTFWRRQRYQEFWALRDFDLRIGKGERIGLIGRNGAGKSTLLKMIAGNVAPTHGTIRVHGRVQALLELGTGFHPEFTGRENIHASLAYQGLSTGAITAKEAEIIDFAELGDFIDQPVKTYSAGMYARLAFSTATAIEPEILIVDEVLGAGDAYFAGKCVERMTRITEQAGATVLFVSHDLGSVQRLCTRAVWIDRGRIRAQGDVLETIKEYQAVVRQDEAERLRARDRRSVATGHGSIDSDHGVYTSRLFRLTWDGTGGSPARVRRLALLHGDTPLGAIEVGGALDNAPTQRHHLVADGDHGGWGPATVGAAAGGRELVARGGHGEAGFVFGVPTRLAGQAMRLEVVVDRTADIPLRVEASSNGAYRDIGAAGPTGRTIIDVPAETMAAAAEPAPAGRDRRASAVVAIEHVEFVDRSGAERRTFADGDLPAACRMRVRMLVPREQVAVALNVLRDDGVVVCSVVHRCTFASPVQGLVELTHGLAALHLGPGRYVASVALYERLDVLDNTREQAVLAIWDRAVSFLVEQSIHYRLPRGIVAPPIDVTAAMRTPEGGVRPCDYTIEDLIRRA